MPNPDSIAFIIVIILLIGLLIRKPRRKVQHPGTFSSGKTPDQLRQEREVRNRADSVLVELQEINREAIARLDNKIRVLNTLVVEADEKIIDLRQLQKQVEKTKRSLVPARRPTPPLISQLAGFKAPEAEDPTAEQAADPNDGETVPDNNDVHVTDDTSDNPKSFDFSSAATQSTAQDSAADEKKYEPAIPSQAKESRKEIHSRYEHIYQLAEDGMDSVKIAAETGMQRGEIDLILRLRSGAS